ncbi:MAG: L-ribulose-5-phosphate 3-epimerase [Spirochaetaceae bacterium]|nr:L-ribulose-5-phosphate 3-epimerase [Spirochaetaceae bacterium]
MEHYRLGLYEKSMPESLSLPEKLKEARAAGFDYMELSIDETEKKLARLAWPESELRSLTVAMADEGIPIKSICLSGLRRYPLGHPDPAVRQRSLEIMQDAIRLATRLGIRLIQIAGYDVYYEPSTEDTKKYFAENLALSAEMAAREGVILAFETMETEFINTVSKARRWVDEIRSPYLQIYPDIGNITNAALLYGTDPLDDLRQGSGHLVALHLKETKPGVYRELRYGEGHVNFPAMTATALSLGVRMFVGEFWFDGKEDWKATLRSSNLFLRDAIRKDLNPAGK